MIVKHALCRLCFLPDILYNITIKYKNRDDDCHYILTPYNFNANVGVKIVGNKFIDLGQGLLDCMLEISTKNGIN